MATTLKRASFLNHNTADQYMGISHYHYHNRQFPLSRLLSSKLIVVFLAQILVLGQMGVTMVPSFRFSDYN